MKCNLLPSPALSTTATTRGLGLEEFPYLPTTWTFSCFIQLLKCMLKAANLNDILVIFLNHVL